MTKNKTHLAELGKQAYTTSTLQIPKALLLYLRERETAFGSRKRYFSHLIAVYGKHLRYYGFSKSARKWKSVYQSQGQALKRADFVPNPEDWEDLRQIALAYGLSICAMFVEILKLEKERYEKAGCPKKFVEMPPRRPTIKGSRMRKRRLKRKNESNLSQSNKTTKENMLNQHPGIGILRQINRNEHSLLRLAWFSD